MRLEFWGLGREGEVVRELLPEFERRNPGVRVEVQQIPWTAAHEKLLTAYVGNAMPDVAQIGNTWIPELQAIGALAPLSPWLRGSKAVEPESFFPGIWDTNTIAGVAYGVPWYVDTRLVFFRSTALRKAGFAEMPRTWSSWVEAMRRIKAHGNGEQFAILLPTNEWNQIVILAMQQGSSLLRDEGRYGAFREPAFRRAFEFYLSLYRDGLAPPVSNTQVANLYQQFAQGYFALYITGPWNIGEFQRRLPEALQDDWTTAPMPAPDGSDPPGVSLAGGSSFCILQASRHKAVAWRLIEYLSAPEQQVRFYALTGDLPAHTAAWRDPVLATNPRVQAFWRQLQRVQATPKVPEWEQIATRVFEVTEEAIRGRFSTDEALATLDHDVDRMLEKRRWMLGHPQRDR